MFNIINTGDLTVVHPMLGFARIEIARWFDQVRVMGEKYLEHYGFEENSSNATLVERFMTSQRGHHPFLDKIIAVHRSDNPVSLHHEITYYF